MTVVELGRRVEALEREVAELRALVAPANGQRRWWREGAGRFANDPVFDEIVRLGREHRESQRPKAPTRKRRKNGDT